MKMAKNSLSHLITTNNDEEFNYFLSFNTHLHHQYYSFNSPNMKSILSSELSSNQHDLLNVIYFQSITNRKIYYIMTHLIRQECFSLYNSSNNLQKNKEEPNVLSCLNLTISFVQCLSAKLRCDRSKLIELSHLLFNFKSFDQ